MALAHFGRARGQLPLSTVGAVEFLSTIAPAAAGTRTGRNAAALVLAVVGVFVLTNVRIGALMLALLPATATVIGLLVLSQVPTWRDLAGVGLVIAGVALHRT